MNIIPFLQQELEQEAQTTRKMLERVPEDQYDWRPHPKSMTLRELAGHLSEIPSWVGLAIHTDELDFAASPYEAPTINNNAELLAFFEQNLAEGRTALEKATDELLHHTWTMRNGEEIYEQNTKYEAIRGCYCQVVHHRAQLGVYLRLLNIPLPSSYGPTADENQWAFA